MVAVLVVLAGCTGGVTPTDTSRSDDAGTVGSGDGTVRLYVSDAPNAIDDFEHLNVTITKVGFKKAGEASEREDAGDDNETADNETADDETADGDAENETDGEEGDGDGDGEWVTYDVDGETVDLTRLQGANATRLADFGVPEGEYDAVFVYVSAVNGTLESGEQVHVKLPSEKLQIHQGFAVGANQSIDFVFDITVTKAGKSGKYVLQPVVSESGTDVEIDEVDRDGERERGEKGDEKRDEAGEKSDEGDEGDEKRDKGDDDHVLNLSLAGNVTPGGDATLTVTRNGSAVANATVEVNDRVVGETDAGGQLAFTVPQGEDLKIDVEAGDAEGELERKFERDDDDRGQGDGNGQGG